MTRLDVLRLRAFGVLIALCLAVVGVVSWLAVPLLPAIGVAVATAAFVLNGFGTRAITACHGCGKDLRHLDSGTHGLMCPDCGTVCQFPIEGDEPDQHA